MIIVDTTFCSNSQFIAIVPYYSSPKDILTSPLNILHRSEIRAVFGFLRTAFYQPNKVDARCEGSVHLYEGLHGVNS